MFYINNIKWKINFVPNRFPLLQRLNGEFTIGACDNLTRTIYISDSIGGKLLKKVLCHEIVHAAIFSYGVNLTIEQEELIADLISTYGEEIINVTNRIFLKLDQIRTDTEY